MKRAYLIAGTFLGITLLTFQIPWASELADSTCYECHEDFRDSITEGSIHEPVADGDCESCHEDHGDEEKLVLADEVPELCFSCHDEYNEQNKHEPVADGSCLDCHQVHSSAATALLNDDMPGLCFECHDDYSEKANVHEPVADGECTECHQAHDSLQGVLMNARYNLNRYAIYSPEEYDLCYGCHDKEPFEDGSMFEGTNFRNGENNLHYLHVYGSVEVNKYGIKKKKEGMTCIGCHRTHSSEQKRLVRHKLDCGETACYTINYRAFEGGGTCVVGCHKPKVYRNSATSSTEDVGREETVPSMARKGGESSSEASQ